MNSAVPYAAQPVREIRDGISLKSVFAVIRRRPRHFWLPLLALTLAGAAAALLLPARYVATALLAIEPATLDEDAPAAPVALTAEQQLPRIGEIVGERALLEKVNHEFGLYPAAGGRLDERQLADLSGRIRTESAGPSTFTVAFEDREPARAARVAGRIAELLVDTQRAEREGRARETAGFIESQLGTLKGEIAGQEREIEEYKRRWFVELPEQVPTVYGQLERAERRLQEVEASNAEARVRLTTIQRELSGLESQGYVKEPAEARLDQLKLDLANLRRRYTERHPDVARTEAEIQELETAMRERRASSVGAAEAPSPARLRQLQLQGELEAARGRLAAGETESRMLSGEKNELLRRMESAPQHEAALAAMTRGYDGAIAKHDALVGQLDDARQNERLEGARRGIYSVVEAPRVPTSPDSPRRLRILVLALLAGIGAGLATALLAEQSDTSFRDVADFRAPSSLPVLAAIPWQTGQRTRLLPALGSPSAVPVALLEDPFGAAAEQYRILAAKLVGRAANSSSMAILVTSSQAGEGKSTAAVNVALALSRMVTEQSVLLVDADPGRPAIHRLLGLDPGPGLAGLLAHPDDDPLRYVRRVNGLNVLDAGDFDPASRDALAAPVAEKVFARLRRRFSCLVVDAPPVLAVAEGMLLQRLVDSTVLVVRARMTPREWLRQALENIDFSRLAGVVLTDVDGRPMAYPYAHAAGFDGRVPA